MKFQYISDIHLDIIPDYNLIKTADYLILAGDIGKPKNENYINFVTKCSQNYIKVFLITGNHEYYNSHFSKTEIDEYITEFVKKFNNVYFLNKSSHLLDDNTIIIGATLWTMVMNNKSYIHNMMCDYSKILQKVYNSNNNYKRYPIKVETTNAWHYMEYKYLIDAIKENQDKKIIIVTHHCPSYKSISPDYKDDLCNEAYASNLEHIFKEYKINFWIHGHTHYKVNYEIEGCRILSNPLGYPKEDTKFNVNSTFDI